MSLVASAARTSSSTSGAILGFADADTARVQLNVTAASGVSPTLDVVVEGTVDGSLWYALGTFAQKTTTGTEVILVQNIVGNQVRVRWTVGGAAASFTFTVAAVTE